MTDNGCNHDHGEFENPSELFRLFCRMREITGGERREVDLNDDANSELRELTDQMEKHALHTGDLEACMFNGKVILTAFGQNYDGVRACGAMVIPIDVFAGVVDGLMPGFVNNVMGHVESQVVQLIAQEQQHKQQTRDTEGDT